MFDFFRSKSAKEYLKDAKDNVYNLPKPTLVPPVPEVVPPKRDATAYRIGKTEEGKVTLSLGDHDTTVVTMNNAGVDQLIRMLEAAKDPENDIDPEPTDDPDGGESLPVDQKRVA